MVYSLLYLASQNLALFLAALGPHLVTTSDNAERVLRSPFPFAGAIEFYSGYLSLSVSTGLLEERTEVGDRKTLLQQLKKFSFRDFGCWPDDSKTG